MKRTGLIQILLLTLITFLLPAFVLSQVGLKGTFFSNDGDVLYVSNALKYIIAHTIWYSDHPGTPSIVLYSYVLAPIRTYSLLILRIDFISWVFNNLALTFQYMRYFVALLFSFSMSLFLLTVYKETKSNLIVILTWLALWVFSFFPQLGTYIGPETLSFFLTSVWLLAFSIFNRSKSNSTLLIMSVVSGIALANKYTNAPLFLITLSLALLLPNLTFKEKIDKLLFHFLVIILTFVVCTIPIIGNYPHMFSWVKLLITTPNVHGGGNVAIFDFKTYLNSINTLIDKDKIPFYIVIISSISVIVLVLRKKINVISPIFFAAFITVCSLAVFSKYSLSHYQLVNYTLMVYLAIYGLRKLPILIKLFLIAFLLLVAFVNFKSYYSNVMVSAHKEYVLEDFIKSNPPKKATLWLWGRSKDFSTLWVLDRTQGVIFRKQLAGSKPKIFELNSNMEDVWFAQRQGKLFDICWDQLYLQESSIETFFRKYPNTNMHYEKLEGTDDMYLVTSNHCINN